MLFKAYKYLVIASWIVGASISLIIAYEFLFKYEQSVNGNKYYIPAFFSFMGAFCLFVAAGLYRRNRIALIAAIPYALFSVAYAHSHIFAEYVWAKYVIQSIIMVIQGFASVHLLMSKTQPELARVI